MKKRIAIWCCLGVVLGVLIYVFKITIDSITLEKEMSLKIQPMLIIMLIGCILGIIMLLIVGTLTWFFKDYTVEEIKQKLKERQLKAKIKKDSKKQKEIEKLNNKIEKLKED